ncbi:hypothetical protein AYO38_08455 [bacterium SCGC AG-212-C10]|nr:hypothetical protein AYO38_08455 [bacterium SCGC AG-212-C10]
MVGLLAAGVLLVSACGDGADPLPTPMLASAAKTATKVAAPTPALSAGTVSSSDFGVAPRLGENVIKVSPAHGTTVTQKSTQTPNPERPGGVCAEVSFDGLPERYPWFRMAIGQKEVTTELTWVIPSQEAKEGKVCYAPETGLEPGRYTAAVSVQNPTDPTQPTKQVVAWSFQVTP